MKKTISILTAALLLLSLCACGNSAPAATQPPVPETPVPSEAPAESPAAESMGQALLKDFTDRVNADFHDFVSYGFLRYGVYDFTE